MFSKPLKTVLAASLVAAPAAGPAAADDLGAALVGGIIGGVIVNEVHKNKQRQRAAAARSRARPNAAYSAARAQNRETQVALNYFGFPAGSADGVLGRRSRAAISQYQAYMGFPATGRLSPYERDFLVSSYSRAQIGGPQVIQAMQGPKGTRGLLHTWRDEATGSRPAASSYGGLPVEVSQAVDEIAASAEPSAEQLLQRSGFLQLADLNGDGRNDYVIDTSVSGSSFWCGAVHCSVMVFASTPQGYQRNDFLARGVTPASFTCSQGSCRMAEAGGTPAPAPQPVAEPQGSGQVMASVEAPAGQAANPLGSLSLIPQQAAASAPASLTSHCSKVSLLTSSNGGYATVANMTDPELALGEQFCLARSYAINSGEARLGKIQGVTQAQADSQCDSLGAALRPFLARLGSEGSPVLMAEVQKFALESKLSLEQLAGTAEICLFSGYRRDNMEVALGSALLLAAIGRRPYGELIGHHLALGFGAGKASGPAQDWYNVAVSALASGAEPAFAPGQPERAELIRVAAARLGGGSLEQTVPAAALPAFPSE
ncbi:peptidoglycan-binding domain-containing protein [Roseobacteraceae bacterium NS-SX3]